MNVTVDGGWMFLSPTFLGVEPAPYEDGGAGYAPMRAAVDRGLALRIRERTVAGLEAALRWWRIAIRRCLSCAAHSGIKSVVLARILPSAGRRARVGWLTRGLNRWNGMQEARFRVWLGQGRKPNVVRARLANCRRVEAFEGDLDTQYDANRLAGLIDRLTYTREDERCRTSPKHKVPINGDVCEGTATLKSAVCLYRDFRREGVQTACSTEAPAKRRTEGRRNQRPGAHWPDWPQPNDEDLLALARATAPFIRFLDPRIVGAVVDDNRRHGPDSPWKKSVRYVGLLRQLGGERLSGLARPVSI